MFQKNKERLGAIFGIILFILFFYFLIQYSNNITEFVMRTGFWAPLIALFLYTILAPTPITTDPITVLLGVTYGPFIGMILALIGNTLAATLEYYIGYRIGDKIKSEIGRKKIPFGLDKLPVNSIPFLIFGRMVPGYGSKIISLLAGGYKVPLRRYIWTTAVTNLFGAIMMSYGGFGIVELLR